jgi:hypothetical protein
LSNDIVESKWSDIITENGPSLTAYGCSL